MLEILLLFAFFTSIGSFSSLVIHRLPIIESGNKSISLILPRSYCPHCEQTLPIKSLIPIFRFVLQKEMEKQVLGQEEEIINLLKPRRTMMEPKFNSAILP